MESAWSKVLRLDDLLMKIIIESTHDSDCMQIARQIRALKLSSGSLIDFESVFERTIRVLGWGKHEKKHSSWEGHFVHLCTKKSVVCVIEHVDKADLSISEFENIVSIAAKNELLAFTGYVSVKSLATATRTIRNNANQFKRFIFKNDWKNKSSLIIHFPSDGLRTDAILSYIRIRCPDVESIKHFENHVVCTKRIRGASDAW